MDVEMIYDRGRACAVHADAARKHGSASWLVRRSDSLPAGIAPHLGPDMYIATPFAADKGELPYMLVGLNLPMLRSLLPSGLERQPGPDWVAVWCESWAEP